MRKMIWVWCFVGALLALLIYMLWEPFRIDTVYLNLDFEELPAEMDGLTLLHLSDLHTSKYGLLEKRARHIVRQMDFDICVITGDLTTKPSAVSAIDKILDFDKHTHPIYVVTGNSEYKPWVDTDAILEQLTGYGYIILSNTSHRYSRGGSSITFVGVDDPYSGNNDVNAAFDGVQQCEFVVALAHCPSISDQMIERGARLVLSGHTHGGQIRLPGVGVVWTHMTHNKQLNDGLYGPQELSAILDKDFKNAFLFVNRGIGTSRVHLRLNCRPHVALITLHSKTAKAN